MASEKQAQLAKEVYLGFLDKLGAHSVLVDKINVHGKKTFAVIAYTDKKLKKAPPLHLKIDDGVRKLNVPLVFSVEEKFII